MNELSLNVLDIAQNSVVAGATLIEITVRTDTAADRLVLSIRDNGKGMDAETLRRVQDPFFTTRTTRDVGLGIPLFKMSAEMTGGSFSIESTPGVGTHTEAVYVLSHIDRMPLGDMAATMTSLIGPNEHIDFVYHCEKNGNSFDLDTREMRGVLGDIPLSSPEVLNFIKNTIDTETMNLS